jgi:acyl carrier protein
MFGRIEPSKSNMRLCTRMGHTTSMLRPMTSFYPSLVARLIGEHLFAVESRREEVTLSSSFNGWGLTAFDSLDTMLIMGLEDEYQKGLDVVKQANLSVSQVCIGCFLLFLLCHLFS